MGALVVANPTLLDVTRRLDPDGHIAMVSELMNQTNEILEDMTQIEGNLPTGHRTTARTGLPSMTWRKLYGGVQPTKSRTLQVTDTCGMAEAYAEIDKALADLNGNSKEYRLSEDRAFIEAMNQGMATKLFYGNDVVTPEEFMGLAPRYSSLSAQSGDNIINSTSAGGGDTPKSIWLICWGPTTIHGIYPKGSIAGLQITDKGQVTIENADGNGGRMEAYRTHYKWDIGLCVRDWRYAVRIQYDEGELTKNAASGADLIDLMTQAVEMLPAQGMGRPAFYMNRTARSYLRRQIANKVAQSTLTMDTVGGKRVLGFDGIPCRRVDSLSTTETRVS